jgi:hypothetical protein
LSVQWKWEDVSHEDDAFLIGFPSAKHLQRVDGFQMGVPSHKATATVTAWKPQDIPHKAELHPIWVHVEGVPYTVRHTTRKRLTAGDPERLTAGAFAFAGDHLAGGNALPPAPSFSPVVICRYPQRLCIFARGIPLAHKPYLYAPAVHI